MNIFLQNTLSGKRETFTPLQPGKVSLYSCGPTVYDFAHIGNFRSFLMADLLERTFRYLGYAVTKVQNITDVGHLVSDADEGEDKILKKARLEKKDPFAIARFFEDAFVEDEKKLRIIPPLHRPRATEFIQEQIDLALKLIEEGYAYESNQSVYFRTEKFKNYGQLSKNNLEELVAGARVEVHSDKESPLDFALWKKADENHLMQWESPWGRGFPGWHIECSAMSQALLGDSFDIHTGGEDNIFPHHECEIAQNEGANGGHKSVNYWLHAKHLLVDGQKMSKSDGNFYTVRDLFEKGWAGNEIRYTLLSAHYRTALNFTFESLEMARASIARLTEAQVILKKIAETSEANEAFIAPFREKFQTALADDLNTADALGVVFDLMKQALKLRDEKALSSEQATSIIHFLETDFDQIFDIFPDKKLLSPEEEVEIQDLITQRKKFREEKNWGESDRIRDELAARGIELVDEDGTTRYRIQ